MSIVLWAGTGVGVVFGLLHAGYIYRLGVREAPAARGFLATHGRAVYDALWALGLWLLFGTYVLVLWVIGVFFYAIHKLRRPVGPAVSRPEPGPDEAGQTPAMDLAGVEKVAIIGAGVAGLSTAKTLMAEGVDCTLWSSPRSAGKFGLVCICRGL